MSLQQVVVQVTNTAPTNGTSLTPVWVGVHGGFDTFDTGRPSSPGLERLAEDGNNSVIAEEFAFSGLGHVDGTAGNAPITPGETVRLELLVDTSQDNARYFSFASMVLPSNDTFIGNENEFAYELFDENGNFNPLNISVLGSEAYDAGTEVNTELPDDTAFFGQQVPDTGVVEGAGVQLAEGFNEVGSGGILDSPDFANADYTVDGYEFAQIGVTSNRSVILGTDEADSLIGTDERELIIGLAGDDTLSGQGERDSLRGRRGDDVLDGGSGNDGLIGGRGNDSLTGGAGRDRFFLQAIEGSDTFVDFQVGEDLIILGNGLSFEELDISGVGSQSEIRVGGSLLATLNNVVASDLSAGSFI